ncbi:unannotated protein [freshwater metagenome]|uniref:Unannotated protein n=1 Tax=freshwater metagenome TaxID=449393 RepID=A0A6J7I8A3_9ZZZZ|nr:transcription termination factor Rho [Actinomycetota bacterium]
MSALSRRSLEDSPLSDLHTIASALGLDGFRRLRKADLIDAIIERQGGEAADDGDSAAAADAAPARAPRTRGTRGGASRSRAARDEDADSGEERPARRARAERTERPERSERPARGERAERTERPARGERAERTPQEEKVLEGTVDVVENGSGFMRLGTTPGDDDVYISAAQIKRCELVSGDRISGPVRPPRRSERYFSLVRVDTINGASADEVAGRGPSSSWDDLAAAFPTQVIEFSAKDPVLKQIADLAPIGRGSRVVIAGAAGSGRTTTLRALAVELAALEGVEVHVVLAGARPEERAEWSGAELEPAAICGLASTGDAQAQAAERVIDAAKRAVAEGGHAAVIIDSLDQLAPQAARRLLAAARNVPDGGSLTIIATAAEAFGGETTVIALDALGAAQERHPVLDAARSNTLRLEALLGDRKATAVAKARAKAASPKS